MPATMKGPDLFLTRFVGDAAVWSVDAAARAYVSGVGWVSLA